ncbi:MAG: hypothetical protein JEY79_09715 [Pseudodesulfovibrio sp.]|nr:hypothetical protein [Pseudodesulfovibrio sp.]
MPKKQTIRNIQAHMRPKKQQISLARRSGERNKDNEKNNKTHEQKPRKTQYAQIIRITKQLARHKTRRKKRNYREKEIPEHAINLAIAR